MTTKNYLPDQTFWGDLLDILEAKPETKRESLAKAVNAIVTSNKTGLITDEETLQMLKWVLSINLNPMLERLDDYVNRTLRFEHSGKSPYFRYSNQGRVTNRLLGSSHAR